MSEKINRGGYVKWTLFFTFLVLKLFGEIDWSWWWITAPLWGDLVLAIFIYGIAGLIRHLKDGK